jgi:general secretion pathway protein G
MMNKRNEGGFTLIELLIVIIILAILAAIVVFAVGTTGANAAAASCESDAKTVETALETYKAELNAYPTADNWGALTGTTAGPTGTVGPFMRSAPSSVHYAINFNGTGNVSADVKGQGSYLASDDVDTGSSTLGQGLADICTINAK